VQQELDRAERSFDKDWLDVIAVVQSSVADEIAASENVPKEDLLQAMRFQSCSFVPFWRKYNRAGRGFVEVDNQAPDCYLFRLESSSYVRFSDLLLSMPSGGVPTVVLVSEIPRPQGY